MVLKVFQNVFSVFNISCTLKTFFFFLKDSAVIIQRNTKDFCVWYVIFSSQGTLNSLCAKSVTQGAQEILQQHSRSKC